MAPTRLVLLEKEKMADINAKVVEIVAERLSVGAETVKPESSFINDLGADSLDIVELVMEFEEAFDIQIPDEESESIRTVGEAVTYIEGVTGGGGDDAGSADAGGDDAGGADAGGDDAAGETGKAEADGDDAGGDDAGGGDAGDADAGGADAGGADAGGDDAGGGDTGEAEAPAAPVEDGGGDESNG